jgi:hypothetical protein
MCLTMRHRAWLLLAALALVGVLIAAALLRAEDDSRPRARSEPRASAKTYEQLVAANYKVLRPRQTRRLLRFAEAFQNCVARSIGLHEPNVLPTRIEMALPEGTLTATVLRLTARCGAKLGDPPRDASLQVRKHAIVLYLPKRCLLDPKTVRGKT